MRFPMGTVSGMPGKPLTPEQNERARAHLRTLLKRYDDNQTLVAPKLGVSQPTLSAFLNGRQGTSYAIVERIAHLLNIDEREILGGRPINVAHFFPKSPEQARQIAAELAKQHGVHQAAILSVVAEEIAPEQQAASVLWWTDHMRWREREMLDLMSRPSASRAAPDESGETLVVAPKGKSKTMR